MRKGWEIKKLHELFDVKSSSRVHQADWKTSGIPFYRAREIVKLAKDGYVNNELYISQELYEELTKIKGAPKEGDILVSAVGTLGQCYLVKGTDKFYFKDASVLWLENLGKVNSRYIDYAFKSDFIINQIMEGSIGATVGTLTIIRAKMIEIPIPPLTEQQEIVSILDDAFESIERAKSIAEQNKKNAKELFDSYLQNIFENKSKDWKQIKLKEICILINGRAYNKEELLNKGKYMVLRVGNFFTNKNWYFSDLELPSDKYCQKGDLLYAWSASFGPKIWEGDKVIYHYHIWKVIPNIDLVTKEFLFILLEWDKEKIKKSLGTGATMMHVSKGSMENRIVPLPPIEVQEFIVKSILDIEKETKKLESLYQQKLNDLEELKKSILQKAFKGELKTSKILS